MKKIPRILATILLALVLAGCGPENPEEQYRDAIAAVDGVENVSVEWNRTGVGDSTRITVSTGTNDSGELRRILDESLRAFIESAGPGEHTTLSYRVLSQNRAVTLNPSDLGPVLQTPGDIRRYYGLE